MPPDLEELENSFPASQQEQEDGDKEEVGNGHDIPVNDDAEEVDWERKDRDSADRHRHSELVKLGAAGAGKSGKIGVCFTTGLLYHSTSLRLALKHAIPLTKPLFRCVGCVRARAASNQRRRRPLAHSCAPSQR